VRGPFSRVADEVRFEIDARGEDGGGGWMDDGDSMIIRQHLQIILEVSTGTGRLPVFLPYSQFIFLSSSSVESFELP
jgi:hypothetical protein